MGLAEPVAGSRTHYPAKEVRLLPPQMANKKMTIVATGQMGGGTTALAGVLRILGVFMGQEGINGANEDGEMQRASTDVNEILRVAEKRNKSHDLWGWKNPIIPIKVIKKIVPELRNPQVIFIFRNPMNVWQRRQQRKPMPAACDRNKAMAQYYFDNTPHTEMISYESLLTDTEATVNKIADIIGIPNTPERNTRVQIACNYIQPDAGYDNIEPHIKKVDNLEKED